MAPELSDTTPDAVRVQAEILRTLSPGERLAQVDGLCAAAAAMATAGLRSQYPAASAAELAAMLADRVRLAWQLEREVDQDAPAAASSSGSPRPGRSRTGSGATSSAS
jgi:hypothetical protein